jgi:hypothetical protein
VGDVGQCGRESWLQGLVDYDMCRKMRYAYASLRPAGMLGSMHDAVRSLYNEIQSTPRTQ